MAELVESGYRSTFFRIDYSPRRVETVRDALLEGWSYLLREDPVPKLPRGYLFTFPGPYIPPTAVVTGYQTELNHSSARSEKYAAEIVQGLLARNEIADKSVLISQSTSLYVHPWGEEFYELNQAVRENSQALTIPFQEELSVQARRRGLHFEFRMGEEVFILRLRPEEGPPLRLDCSLEARYETMGSEEDEILQTLNQHGTHLERLTSIIPQVVSLN